MTDVDELLWWYFAVFHTVSLIIAYRLGEVDAWQQSILAAAYLVALFASGQRWWQQRSRRLERNCRLVDDDDGG